MRENICNQQRILYNLICFSCGRSMLFRWKMVAIEKLQKSSSMAENCSLQTNKTTFKCSKTCSSCFIRVIVSCVSILIHFHGNVSSHRYSHRRISCGGFLRSITSNGIFAAGEQNEKTQNQMAQLLSKRMSSTHLFRSKVVASKTRIISKLLTFMWNIAHSAMPSPSPPVAANVFIRVFILYK